MGPLGVVDVLESCLFCGNTLEYCLLGMNGFTMGLDLCNGTVVPMRGLGREKVFSLFNRGGTDLFEFARIGMLGGNVGSIGIESCRFSFIAAGSAIGNEVFLLFDALLEKTVAPRTVGPTTFERATLNSEATPEENDVSLSCSRGGKTGKTEDS